MPVKRTPVRTPVKAAKKVKVKSDPIAEYKERVKKLDYVDMLPLSDDSVLSRVKRRISTQSLPLDRLLGGGIPCGRVTEIYGPEGIGKSALTDHIAAACQREGGLANLLDTEQTRDVGFSRQIGVDVAKFMITQFVRDQQTVENVFQFLADQIDFWATKHPEQLVLYVWDSVAGTSTKDELKGDVGESHGAKPAQMLKRGMRRIVPKLAGTNIAVVMLNHQYTPVGFTGYGPKPQMVYGGKGIAYLASLRLKMFRMGVIKDPSGVVRGNKVGIRADKIKTNDQWGRIAEIGMMHGVGIDNVWSIYEAMKDRGFITTGGGWSAMQLEGDPAMKWQGGWLGLGEQCRENPELFDKLVRVYHSISPVAPGAQEDE